MGLNSQSISYIKQYIQNDTHKDNVLTLGVQKCSDKTYRSTNDFLTSVGYKTIDTLDKFDYESPTIIHDLNTPIQQKYKYKFDLVIDSGTLEHCFDIKQVMYNISNMLKLGGRIIHINPYSGWVRHGFYRFTEILYHDFYITNGYNKLTHDIFNVDGKKELIAFTAVKESIKQLEVPIQGRYKNKCQTL